MDARESLARALLRSEVDVYSEDPWEEAGEELHTAYLAAEDAIIEELDRLRKRVADLEAGLQWALNEGGWRLWYHALDHGRQPPPVIEVPKRVGDVARIRPMEEAG